MPRSLRNDARRCRGFSLIEILTAVAVLSLIMIVLVNLTSQTGKIWSQGERQNQYRFKARTSLEYMAKELRQAVISLDLQSASYSGAVKRQFWINPNTITAAYGNHDSLFWLAPLGTGSYSGCLAEVGYFVKWDTVKKQSNLCRFFVNPDVTPGSNFEIYRSPSNWITDALLTSVAPADRANNYQGLFLENVLGLWITAYRADGTVYNSDSWTEGKRLPAYVELSMVFIDATGNTKLNLMGLASDVQTRAQSATSADAFVNTLPASYNPLKAQIGLTSLKVSLDNYK